MNTFFPADRGLSVLKTENEIIRSKSGHDFDPQSNTWKLSKDISVNVGMLLSESDGSLHHGLRKVLIYYSQNYSPSHVLNCVQSLLHFFRHGEAPKINDISLINYRSVSKSNYEHIGRLRSFFRQWYRLGYAGIEKPTVDMLDSWRIPGNIKGQAVKRLDPTEGPFSDLELEEFNDGAVAAFERDEIDIQELAVSLLTSNTGRRPIQLSHLKCCDLWCAQGEAPRYFLNVPRAKQGLKFREAFKVFEITQELWAILAAQVASVKRWYVECGGSEIEDILKQLPIFPGRRILAKAIRTSGFLKGLATDKYHMRSNYVTMMLKSVAEKAGIYSHRTDEELNVFAKRFRYTVGTRAAREGMSKYIIAELLDHSDVQNVDSYTLNVPEFIEKIDAAVAYQLIPLVQAFSGVLVDSEGDARRGHDPRSRVRNEKFGCGTCGHFGFCGAMAPISCYTCIHFQPWLDAPHEEVLDQLISERDLVISTTGDFTMAAISNRTILAVADVVKRCEARRLELKSQEVNDE